MCQLRGAKKKHKPVWESRTRTGFLNTMKENQTYHFSKSSKAKLETCDKLLQQIANRAIMLVDFTVLCGVRDKEEQNRLFREGKSKVAWPQSKHNIESPDQLSKAFDIAPYPIEWKDKGRFFFLAGVIKGTAAQLGIKIRWGGDWDSDNDFEDQNFDDLVHFELVEE